MSDPIPLKEEQSKKSAMHSSRSETQGTRKQDPTPSRKKPERVQSTPIDPESSKIHEIDPESKIGFPRANVCGSESRNCSRLNSQVFRSLLVKCVLLSAAATILASIFLVYPSSQYGGLPKTSQQGSRGTSAGLRGRYCSSSGSGYLASINQLIRFH